MSLAKSRKVLKGSHAPKPEAPKPEAPKLKDK